MDREIIHSVGLLPLETDCIIALGKNIGVGWTPEDIRNDPDHLSDDSRIITRALGSLLLGRPWRYGILSGGKTAGPDFPSQPQAARDYLRRQYPTISPDNIILEENSIDTAGSAQNVPPIVKRKVFQNIGLLSVGYHLSNAATLFENYGLPIKTLIAAEDIVSGMSEEDSIAISKWRRSSRVLKETRKETIRELVLRVDPRGQLARKITKVSRR